jgi:hypothetical protein
MAGDTQVEKVFHDYAVHCAMIPNARPSPQVQIGAKQTITATKNPHCSDTESPTLCLLPDRTAP